jgi:hypothetical protein
MFKSIQRFLNRYIFKRKEYAEIVRKQKEIAERNRKGLLRKWIKKDLLNILGEEAHDLMTLDDIVDYILERESK